MPGLLEAESLDLASAVRQLGELRSRHRQLLAVAALLAAAGASLVALGREGVGVPLGIGAAAAVGLWALCRTDRRRLLVRLVAQGDAFSLAEVQALARKLCSQRERRRLASGLRAAADAGATGSQLSIMVDPARADGASDRLRALAEAFADPLVAVSPPAAALCRRLLCDAMHSPLYNPHVPEPELGRILDVLEHGMARPAV